MTLGHRVCVMRGGILQQAASPQDVYNRPANLFVAGFIGSPPMNLMRGTLEQQGDTLAVRLGETILEVDPEVARSRPALAGYAGREVAVGLRPEDVEDAALVGDAGRRARLRTHVDIREDMGAEVFLHVPAFAPPALTDDVRDALEDAAAEDETRTAFVARVDRASRAAAGEAVELVVDTRRLHFFDLASGAAIDGDAR
jgi:multiple sugar transport system ATP-binding protein